eukprot:snap_masked-scaffold372_size192401-processed-gene-0.28 protein:Tk00585 transcript:snap_masked-scaffold372_size192401-processed-gene-0.28-mRNA-1 annotation:"tissue factor pathway inhibitor isoform x1"
MAISTSHVVFGLFSLLLFVTTLITIWVAIDIISGQIHEDLDFFNTTIKVLQKRIADLEAENDYLFEEHGVQNGSHLPFSLPTTYEELAHKPPDPDGLITATQPELCQLSAAIGPCNSQITRWFFDGVAQACRAFAWSGCGGNENNFLTSTQCEAACGTSINGPSHSPISFDSQNLFNASACYLAPDAGPCPQRWPRFYHYEGHCFPFAYGGCAGNENNFFSELECQMKCHPSPAQGAIEVEDAPFSSQGLPSDHESSLDQEEDNDDDACQQPLDRGSCDMNVTRYFYDPIIADCESFVFGGCQGNRNNFAQRHKCRKICLS